MNFPARLNLRWKEISALERLFVARTHDGELERCDRPTNVNVWLKRDDRNELYGGNKIRKLEYLLGDAKARGKSTVLTFGRIGSNHALATAVHAANHDMKAICVLLDQPRTQKVAQTLRWHLHVGTQLEILADPNATVADAERVAERIISHTDAYRIAWGGSMAVGSLGWVDAGYSEVPQQLRSNGIAGDVRIYLPCGSMGTTSGLLLGLALARADERIKVNAVNILRVSAALHRTLDLIGVKVVDEERAHHCDVRHCVRRNAATERDELDA
jgi:1-aminocyclopropane-1-carboxylate deaminase/D-cysteine desulfhydrase-like pyridoxal-dependent ACC family enzyme